MEELLTVLYWWFCKMKPGYCWEEANPIALSGIALQHADDGYSSGGNFCGSLVRSIILIYSPDGTNVSSSRGGEFEGIFLVSLSGIAVQHADDGYSRHGNFGILFIHSRVLHQRLWFNRWGVRWGNFGVGVESCTIVVLGTLPVHYWDVILPIWPTFLPISTIESRVS